MYGRRTSAMREVDGKLLQRHAAQKLLACRAGLCHKGKLAGAMLCTKKPYGILALSLLRSPLAKQTRLTVEGHLCYGVGVPLNGANGLYNTAGFTFASSELS